MQSEFEALVRLGRALRAEGYTYTTVTPETHHRVNIRALSEYGNGDARNLRDVFGWNRCFERCLLPGPWFELLEAAHALSPVGGRFQARVRFSTLGGMLLAHSEYPTVQADAVFFGPDTYRFCRLLAHWAPRAQRVVDIGCGTGAGGLLLAGLGAQQVVLADVNPRALAYAEVNAALAGRCVTIVASDVLQSVDGNIDLIVANPPYMRDPTARTYRNGGGLYGEALGVRIVREALSRLDRGGTLIVYTGAAIVNGTDQFLRAVEPHLDVRCADVVYEELDPDVFGDELDRPQYAHVERIAAVGLKIRLR